MWSPLYADIKAITHLKWPDKSHKVVDPIVFVQSKEGVQLLTIRREDGTRALLGEMIEDRVNAPCVDDILKECFSGDLFAIDSLSLVALFDTPEITLDTVKAELTKFIMRDIQLESVKLVIEQSQCKGAVIGEVISAIQSMPETEEFCSKVKEEKCTQLKLELYKALLPKSYNYFRHLMQVNASVDKPLMSVTLNSKKLFDLCIASLINLSPRQPSNTVELIDLDVFCNEENHAEDAALVLDALAEAIYENRIAPNHAFKQQIVKINEQLQSPIDSRLLEQHLNAPIDNPIKVSENGVFRPYKRKIAEVDTTEHQASTTMSSEC